MQFIVGNYLDAVDTSIQHNYQRQGYANMLSINTNTHNRPSMLLNSLDPAMLGPYSAHIDNHRMGPFSAHTEDQSSYSARIEGQNMVLNSPLDFTAHPSFAPQQFLDSTIPSPQPTLHSPKARQESKFHNMTPLAFQQSDGRYSRRVQMKGDLAFQQQEKLELQSRAIKMSRMHELQDEQELQLKKFQTQEMQRQGYSKQEAFSPMQTPQAGTFSPMQINQDTMDLSFGRGEMNLTPMSMHDGDFQHQNSMHEDFQQQQQQNVNMHKFPQQQNVNMHKDFQHQQPNQNFQPVNMKDPHQGNMQDTDFQQRQVNNYILDSHSQQVNNFKAPQAPAAAYFNIVQEYHLHQPNTLSCSISGCPRRFSTNESLQMHLMNHGDTKPKPFACTMCTQSFSRSHGIF